MDHVLTRPPSLSEFPLTALFVDDDSSFLHMLGLRLHGIYPKATIRTCETLADARACLNELPRPSFDLVVLDLHLPDGIGPELLEEGLITSHAVLVVSSDLRPAIAGQALKAGASFFLNKRDVSQPLFGPLIAGMLEQATLRKELEEARIAVAISDTVHTLVSTLRHEINNPLGAVLGATYLLQHNKVMNPELTHVAQLIEESGKRIKQVLDRLCEAMEFEKITKGATDVFQVPGDESWEISIKDKI